MANYKGIGFDTTNGKQRTGTSADSIDFDTNLSVAGNLDVTGNIISRDEERVLVQDNFLDVNFGYTGTTALEGGLAANYKTQAASTNLSIVTSGNTLTFSAASGSTRPKVVAGTASGIPQNTFASSDLVQIAGTTNAENDGIYVVNTNGVAGTIEFNSTAITSPDTINAKFAQVNFTAQAVSSGTVTISKVNIGALQVNASGNWEVQSGNTDSTFSSYSPLGTSTLQQAYDAGATITTDASGAIAFTLSADNQGFTVEGSSGGNGDVSIGGTTAVSKYDLNASGAASSVKTTGQNLTVETVSSGELKLAAAGLLNVDGAAGLDMDLTGAASDITSTGQNLTIQTATSGTLALTSVAALDLDGTTVTVDGSNGVSIGGSGAASDFTSAGQNLTIQTTTSGELDLTAAGLMDINAAANLDIDVTGTFDMLSTGAFSIDGTGASNVTATSGNLSLETDTSGSLVLNSAADVDINGTTNVTIDGTGISIDGTAASNLTATGANLTVSTATSGDVLISSAGEVDLTSTGLMDFNAGANLDIDVTGTADLDASGAVTLTSTNNSGGSVVLNANAANGSAVLANQGTAVLTAAASLITAAQPVTCSSTLDVASTSTFADNITLDKLTSQSITAAFNNGSDQTFSIDASNSGAGDAVIDIGANAAQVLLDNGSVSTLVLTAGEGISAGQVVCVGTSGGTAGQALKADRSSSAKVNIVGFAMETVTATNPVKIQQFGKIPSSGLTGGQKLFLSTAGAVTATAPSSSGDTVYQVGFAESATSLVISLQFIMEIG
jgi:hypothetical protein